MNGASSPFAFWTSAAPWLALVAFGVSLAREAFSSAAPAAEAEVRLVSRIRRFFGMPK